MLFHLSLACVLSTAVAMAYPQAYSPPTYPPFGNTSHPQPPLSNAEFGLRMRVPNPINPYAGLVATKNGTSGQLLMVAHTLSGPDTAYDTTPAYTVGTESVGTQKLYGPNFVELNLDVNGTQYGLSTPDIVSTISWHCDPGLEHRRYTHILTFMKGRDSRHCLPCHRIRRVSCQRMARCQHGRSQS